MANMTPIARSLADEFRPRAGDYDRSGEFPHDNYESMREAGYLKALVPVELGGLGAGLADAAHAQQALARGCASTALAVNMHQFQVGVAADAWRKGGPTEPLLRRIATEGIILASTGAEALVAGDWQTPTTADRQGDSYLLNGRKYFCSQAPVMNLLRVNATDTATGDLMIFTVPATAEGLSVIPTWDTQGMRATASHDVVLKDVRVPEAALGARLPAGAPMRHPSIANVVRWFEPLIASVYLGIAEEARFEAYRAANKGRNGSFRNLVMTDVLFGEMEAAFLTARSVRDSVIDELDREPADPQHGVALAVLCKEVVTANAMTVVDKAVEIAGAGSYFRSSPLERLHRDARAGRFHPPASPVSYQVAGERAREQSWVGERFRKWRPP